MKLIICLLIPVILLGGCSSEKKLQSTIKDQQNQIDEMRKLDKTTLEMLNGMTTQFANCKAESEKAKAEYEAKINSLQEQLQAEKAKLETEKALNSQEPGKVQQGVEELRNLQRRAAEQARAKSAEPNATK